jgi:hypothetical protein
VQHRGHSGEYYRTVELAEVQSSSVLTVGRKGTRRLISCKLMIRLSGHTLISDCRKVKEGTCCRGSGLAASKQTLF